MLRNLGPTSKCIIQRNLKVDGQNSLDAQIISEDKKKTKNQPAKITTFLTLVERDCSKFNLKSNLKKQTIFVNESARGKSCLNKTCQNQDFYLKQ